MADSSVATTEARTTAPLAQRAGRALGWNVLFLPIKAVLAVAVSVVLVRGLPRTGFESYAVATSLLATIGLYSDLGIERALPRFVPEIERAYGRRGLLIFVFRITALKLTILAGVGAGLWLAADWLIRSQNLGSDEQARTLLAMIVALLILGAVYDICTQFLYSFFKQKITNLLDIIVAVVKPVLTVGFVALGWGVVGVMLGLLLTTILSVAIAIRQAWRAAGEARVTGTLGRLKVRERESPITVEGIEPSVATATTIEVAGSVATVEAYKAKTTPTQNAQSITRRFINYAALMYFFKITAWLYDTPFIILLFQQSADPRATLYVVVVKVVYNLTGQLLQTLQAPFVGIQTPLFATLHAEGRRAGLKTAYATLSKLQILLLVPTGAGLCIVGANLLNLLYIQKIRATDTLTDADVPLATTALVLVVLFSFTESLISIPVTILTVFERYRIVIAGRLLTMLIAPLLVVSIFLDWGLVVALLIMGSLSVASRLLSLVAVRQYGLYYPVGFLLKVVGATLAFTLPVGTVLALLPPNPVLMFGAVAVSAAIFVGAFKLLGGLDKEDKDRLAAYRIPFNKYIRKYL